MAPRSPTHAFDPTPALDHNSSNFSPFNHKSNMLSLDSYHPGLNKEVRFAEPTAGPFHRAHSIATENVPLLPAIASASAVPKTSFRITNPAPGIDITAYIENCRNLNEQLRQAHEAERRAWNIERTALKSRIADLEFALNKSNDAKRRASNDAQPHSSYHSSRSDFRAIYQANVAGAHKAASDSIVPTIAPVWKGPETTPPITRVFQTEETNGHHLPSISEDEPLPSLSKEVSPSTVVDSEPIPVEKVDSTLDGITLKSAGLASSFVTKITSPQFGSPAQSPSSKPSDEQPSDKVLHIDASGLLSPLDEKLKRYAGHTPLAMPDDINISTIPSDQTTEITTPLAEQPVAPAPTKRPPLRPSENSDSYFSTVSDDEVKETIKQEAGNGMILEEGEPQPQFETEDDKPLTGPLMLDPSARTKAASAFLDQLDAKLEAVRETSPDRRQSFATTSSVGDNAREAPAQPEPANKKAEPDDDMPKLKLKKSTNFGSAYGFNMPGKAW